MAGSRKAFLKKTSPYRGTGRYLQYLRCPVCGALKRGQQIGNAGTHELTVSQCIRKLPGYRTGWEWGHTEPDRDMLLALEESLERALAQVKGKLVHLDTVRPAEVLSEYQLHPEAVLEHYLRPEVLGEWHIPGNELEAFYGNEDGNQTQGQEEEDGEVIYPGRVRFDSV